MFEAIEVFVQAGAELLRERPPRSADRLSCAATIAHLLFVDADAQQRERGSGRGSAATAAGRGTAAAPAARIDAARLQQELDDLGLGADRRWARLRASEDVRLWTHNPPITKRERARRTAVPSTKCKGEIPG